MQVHRQLECFMSISLLVTLRTIQEMIEISKVQELSRFDITVTRSEKEKGGPHLHFETRKTGQLNI